METANELIKSPRILPLAIKRLSTKDGLCHASKFVRIGDIFRIDKDSTRMVKGITESGVETQQVIIDVVDESGNPLGWMYAELFFGD